jgi:polar amino acid transport system substrate-binding protein
LKISTTALAGVTAALALLLAGCGDHSDTLSAADKAVGAPTTSAAAASSTASSTAVPTEDVVSGIATDPKLHAELPAAVQQSGRLLLGTTEATGEAFLPHAGSTADGTQIGLDVDLRDAVAKVLGVTWKVGFGSFETIVPGTQSGKYDVGQGNFAVTSERLKVVDFATYLKDGQSFIAAAGSDLGSVKTLADICGHTVSTTPGSSFQQILEQGASACTSAGKKPYKVQYFKDQSAILLGLQNGKTDLFFGPTLSLKYIVSHQPGLKFLGEISSTDVGFVTAKGSPLTQPLVDAVNALIASGDYERIFAKWGVPGIGIQKSELNPKPAF